LLDVPRLIREAHGKNISVIARLVAFKDKKLFFYEKHKYAYGKKGSSLPWQYFREYWVDAHCEEVWDYNISIARELEGLGLDEIQFDYIRFPSDGPKHLIVSRCQPTENNVKSESLDDFLARANNEVKIPIGVDLYGFNSWYNAGAVIGQDIVLFSRNVQVVSPMYYPSHFGSRWFITKPLSLRSYRILHAGTSRSLALAGPGVVVRPFLQAFNYKSPGFGTGYILNQVQGVIDSGGESFLFWNIRGDYAKVYRALAEWNPATYQAK
jgi:hypothetical protein